ncbi:MAG: sensor histidine kinase [Cyclobacteriaceae bacterium]
MIKKVKSSQLINVALIIGNVVYAILDDAGLGEIINLLWILLLTVYVFIPGFFHEKKYVAFTGSIIGSIVLGVIVMEVFIEGDAELYMFFELWTWIHEMPFLLWPVLFTALIKVSGDLLINQDNIIEMERKRAESEIRFLKSQLSPHMLFNNLNNIYSFALHQSKETPTLLLKLADIMRYMLYETQEEQVLLTKELTYVDNYFEFQQLQLENRGELRYEKIGDPTNKFISPMMLICFIENCFKHAAASTIDELKIIIQIEITEDSINLFTENSYTKKEGEDEEEALQESGIGLANIKRRLELLYPKRHTLIIKELTNLYIVNLTIELEQT